MQNIVDEVNQYKDMYYESNKKNSFFKEKQKTELTNQISNNFDMKQLIDATTTIIPNANKVYINYEIFKLYANENNFQLIINDILMKFTACLEKYKTFECHVNIAGFTTTAAKRYQSMIKLFCNTCVLNKTDHTTDVSMLYVYNTPNVFDAIRKIMNPFIHENIKSKIATISKEDSEEKLKDLLKLTRN